MKITALIVGFLASLFTVHADERPNILFIAIDDINDWIGPLGGHPQVQTPNMDRFFEEGAVVFKNAVCAAPTCGPSRSAILSGFMPNRTGVYGNGTNMIYADLVKENATLPEYFSKHGYHTLSNGKIFHKHMEAEGTDFGHWAFDEHARSRKGVKDSAIKEHYTSAKAGIIDGEKRSGYMDKGAKLSWGPTKKPFERTVDYLVADWSREQLKKERDQPFFMAVGIIKPHLPWMVPQEFFDLYDLDTLEVPQVKEDDLDDILRPNGQPEHEPSADYLWVKAHGLEKEATQAYLANISYADACLGIVLDALEESGQADNTIVVIWGDHGWHLGEKQRYLKNALWSETVKVPFLVRVPGMTKGAYSDATVSLIDMYPTLVSLAGLPGKELDGRDISPLLCEPNTEWPHHGVTVSQRGTSVLGQRWHYIQYLSGAEELYDTQSDPMEWNNLIQSPEYTGIVEQMRQSVPAERVQLKTKVYKKSKDYVDGPADPTIKDTRNLSELN